MCIDRYRKRSMYSNLVRTAAAGIKRLLLLNLQIRRIIGALCAVAEGKIVERDIYEMLTIPSYRMWDDLAERKLIQTAPACGLYFIGLNYRPEEVRYTGPVRLTPRGVRVRSFVVNTIIPNDLSLSKFRNGIK